MRLHDGRAVPAFMSQALRGEDVTIFGDGTQTRSFCFVTDLVDGILRLMASSTNDPVNIGNPHEVSIEEIARTIIAPGGIEEPAGLPPAAGGRSEAAAPDITRARTLLGWEPKVGLEEGLKKTVGLLQGEGRSGTVGRVASAARLTRQRCRRTFRTAMPEQRGDFGTADLVRGVALEGVARRALARRDSAPVPYGSCRNASIVFGLAAPRAVHVVRAR